MAKAKKATKTIEGNTIKFTFATGETLEADVNKLSNDMKVRACIHGIGQKLQDSYAGADEKEAYECAKKVWDGIINGDWTVRAEGGGSRTTQFIEALAAILGKSVEEAQTKLEEKSEDEIKAMKKHPQVVAKIAEIKADRAAKELKKVQEAAKDSEAGKLAL